MGHGRHRTVRIALVAAVVAASAVASVTPGGAQDGDLWFSPDAVAAGDSFDVGGTCDADQSDGRALVSASAVDGGYIFSTFFDLDEDGVLEGVVDVPPEMPAGTYYVFMGCGPIAVPAPSQVGAHQAPTDVLEVLPFDGQLPIGVVFTPDSVSVGDPVVVSGVCIMGDADMAAGIFAWTAPVPGPFLEPRLRTGFSLVLETAADGSFEETVVIEADQQPGEYIADKQCWTSGGDRSYFVSGGGLTVLGDTAPPPPVPVAPRFTG